MPLLGAVFYLFLCQGIVQNISHIHLNNQIMIKAEGMLKADALKGKTIIITGGGTGLGRSIGEYCLELGANLVICSRRMEVLEKSRPGNDGQKRRNCSTSSMRCPRIQ